MVYQTTPSLGTPYFTPYQAVPSGTSLEKPEDTPALFRPLQIRGSTFPNRLWCAPMCMYSADVGRLTDFHLQHLGSIATRGAGLVMVEATAVLPEGRISKDDSGLWEDTQIEPLERIATYVHSQNHHLSIQLAHAGRKASSCAPWLKGRGVSVLVGREMGGWPDAVVGPSPIAWDPNYALPHELNLQEIRGVTNAFAAAAKRAVRAGVDSIEIHAAHGYLLNSFLSGASNRRTDEYGGSFEGRTRIVFETIAAVRAVIPSTMPLFLRVSSTDWLDEKKYPTTWGVADTIRLAKLLYVRGVDLLDCSSGGNHPEQKIQPHNEYQIDIAGQVKKALREEEGEVGKLLIGAVGGVGGGKRADRIVADGIADVVLAGRAFLRDSGFTLTCADELGVKVQWPLQYLRKGRRAVEKSSL